MSAKYNVKKQDDGNRERSIMRITTVGAVCNCVLTFFKITAGVTGNSAAMVADGIHSLSDLVSDFIIIVFVRISSKGQDKKHDYGHGKFETLATLFVSIMLFLVGLKIFMSGADEIQETAAAGNDSTLHGPDFNRHKGNTISGNRTCGTAG